MSVIVPPIFMNGSYNIILADPPWVYRDKAKAGDRGAESKYPCLSLYDIKSLNVQSIAAPDSMLFLWVTMPLLSEGLEVIAAWGFKHKTTAFTWIKLNKDGTPFRGMGHYTRSNSELCLLGTRGKPVVKNHSVGQVILTPRTMHSEKPLETHKRIVQLCGDVPRVELFARKEISGWDAIGNDIDGQDIRNILNNKRHTIQSTHLL